MTTPMASAPKQLETKWTPGPWVAQFHNERRDGGRFYVYITTVSPEGLVPVAAVPAGVEGYGREEGRANASLIAAAPEMVEVLEWLCEQMLADQEAGVSGFEDWLAPARAAIAKASGQ